MRTPRLLLASVYVVASATAAYADEVPGWQKGDIVISAGLGAITINSSAEISLGGNRIADGNIKLSGSTIVGASAEYFLAPEISFAFVGGIPPTTRATGTGSLEPSGELGRVTYGLASVVGRYHLNGSGRISPYLGGGLSRFIVFSTKDGSVTGLKASGAWAPVLQSGIDYHLSRHIGLFANATYIPVKSQARGTSRGLPLIGNATLKATTIKAGLTYRF